MRIGELIQKTRYARAMTQAELAEVSGVTRAVIANIESGRNEDPSFGQVTEIARVLRIPPSVLFSFKSEAYAEFEEIVRQASAYRKVLKAIRREEGER